MASGLTDDHIRLMKDQRKILETIGYYDDPNKENKKEVKNMATKKAEKTQFEAHSMQEKYKFHKERALQIPKEHKMTPAEKRAYSAGYAKCADTNAKIFRKENPHYVRKTESKFYKKWLLSEKQLAASIAGDC